MIDGGRSAHQYQSKLLATGVCSSFAFSLTFFLFRFTHVRPIAVNLRQYRRRHSLGSVVTSKRKSFSALQSFKHFLFENSTMQISYLAI